ncbi:hypothetical protein BY996DRAFT_6411866 [Phakopsora pachyrhizi]|nr:hypothetical protein BY996DRAFT_6411866 [Phakopsora pachyrhizi]
MAWKKCEGKGINGKVSMVDERLKSWSRHSSSNEQYRTSSPPVPLRGYGTRIMQCFYRPFSAAASETINDFQNYRKISNTLVSYLTMYRLANQYSLVVPYATHTGYWMLKNQNFDLWGAEELNVCKLNKVFSKALVTAGLKVLHIICHVFN